MNSSPTRSPSSRASVSSAAICSVTRFSCSSASATGLGGVGERRSAAPRRPGSSTGEVGVEQELDEHHRVVPLLDRLPVEVRGEERQRLGVVVDRDRDVLLRGRELVADLLVQRLREACHRGNSISLHPMSRCILRIHAAEADLDRGCGRARLPQLQRRLPGPRGVRGRRLHRDADPGHRRARLPRRSRRRRSIRTGSRSGPRPSSSELIREHERGRGRLRVLGRHARARDARRARACSPPARTSACSPRTTRRSTSSKPSVAICAVRTGSGKSQTTRRVAQLLRDDGKRVAVLRHPMPYGDLDEAGRPALRALRGPRRRRLHDRGARGVRAAPRRGQPRLRRRRLRRDPRAAEQEADVIVWDGGNNDTPFVRPDLHIVVVDPHRPGHELRYHPGETNLRMARRLHRQQGRQRRPAGIDAVLDSIAHANPAATVVRAASPIQIEGDASAIEGKRVLAIEDGPTLTHGEMTYGAAVLAAKADGAAELVDPRPYAVGSIAATFDRVSRTSEPSCRRWATGAADGRSRRDDQALRRRPRPDRDADRPPPADRLRACRRCASPIASRRSASRRLPMCSASTA